MRKNKIIIVASASAAILIIIVLNLAVRNKKNQEYVLNKNDNVKLKDVETYYELMDFDEDDLREYFKDDVVNQRTLKFFMHMDEMFKDSTGLEDNLERARQYLDSVMSPRLADKMLGLYKTYLEYQIDLQSKIKEWDVPLTPDEAIARLHRLQNYRRSVFGMEDADAIFGAGVKAEEYSIRRNAIINDNNLHGDEKERKLHTLDGNMWGDEANTLDADVMPYTRYQEKLRLYKKDLSELHSEEERQEKLRQFRREIFDPDQTRRFEDVDRLIADEKKVQEQYVAREMEIQSDSNLDQEAKEKKMRELQDATFGDEADAFRRSRAIEKVLKQARK